MVNVAALDGACWISRTTMETATGLATAVWYSALGTNTLT